MSATDAAAGTAPTAEAAPAERRVSWRPSRALALRAAILLPLAAIPRIWAALNDNGIFWPDETYQTLEQAHRLAFGYGFIPWEFRDAARSWVFPAFLGAYWKLLSLLGVSQALSLVAGAKLLMVAIALAGIALMMRLAEKLDGPAAITLAGALGGFFPASLVYGSRVMTEMVSGPVILVAVLLCMEPGKRRNLAAGAVAALTIYFRYQNGIVAVGLMLWLMAQRRDRDMLHFGIGAVVVGLAGGLLDWFTWGAPFKAFKTYVEFNLTKSAGFGTSPPPYFVEHLWSSVGVPLLVLAVGFFFAAIRERGLGLILLVYLALHSAIPHKEFRFLMPIVPLMLTLSAVGLARLLALVGADGWPADALAASLALCGGMAAVGTSFAKMGQYEGSAGGLHSPWHAGEDCNLLITRAGQAPDLCGLIVAGIAPAWQGGYTYLHRNVPILFNLNGRDATQANYLVIPANAGVPPAWQRLETLEGFSLYRRDGACAPFPDFKYHLP